MSNASLLEDSELGNKVMIVQVSVSRNTLFSSVDSVVAVGEVLWEELHLKERGHPVSASEGGEGDWELHPGLPEQWVNQGSLLLEWSHLVSGERTSGDIEQHLPTLELLVLKDLGSGIPVVVILVLDSLNLVLSEPDEVIRHISELFINLKFGVHFTQIINYKIITKVTIRFYLSTALSLTY